MHYTNNIYIEGNKSHCIPKNIIFLVTVHTTADEKVFAVGYMVVPVTVKNPLLKRDTTRYT